MEQTVEVSKRTADRRSFLKGAGVSGLALAGAALLGTKNADAQAQATSFTATDIEVFNFALNLEYLESEFYTQAFYGKTIEEMGVPITGVGTPGPTTGGKQVNFTVEQGGGFQEREFSGQLSAIAEEITIDEQNHVRILRNLLGDKAIAKPTIDLNATGSGFKNFSEFLGLARTFEDVGVSAYGGAATLLSTQALSYGARIALVEAYHASALRLLVSLNYVKSYPVDTQDVPPPPIGDQYQYFTTYRALAVVRTPSEVLSIVYGNSAKGANKGGFFPYGVNGAITTV